ncbi:kynureninase-like [Pectinophora gossypiella]|uniref:kynureninase-like n=1 Tax=Pectinophora gossypiella TaxID=13191 RepID=UPI00214DF747|nr:kynureninase-like [Pectinophora gossypiella]
MEEKHNKFEDGPSFPLVLDNNDELGHFRHRFHLKTDVIYLCGNSLGLASKDAEDAIYHAMEAWKTEGIGLFSLNDSKYFLYSKCIAKLMATLIGADTDEIAIMNNTTVNIHQSISTLYKPTKERYKILVDDVNFPTDKYAVDGQVRLKGLDPEDAVKIVKARGKFIHEQDIIDAMTDDVAIVFLPLVYYRTAQIMDMKTITKTANQRGIIVGWDFCHAVGAIPIDLKSVDVDFAIWCTYKYLNGGPGAPAGLYINRKHFDKLPGLPGWYGSKPQTQFLLHQNFDHQQNASGLQLGTPSIISMAGVEGSLRIFEEAGIENVRRKSLHITAYLMHLIETKLFHYGFGIGNLREDSKRGGHVCLEHDEGYRISLALKARSVVSDYRDPNVIRLTPTALYTSYVEVYKTVEILVDIMKNKSYEMFSVKRAIVV